MEDDLPLEKVWYARCLRDLGTEVCSLRPSPLRWYFFFLEGLRLDEYRGHKFSEKIMKTIFELVDDSMTTLQELVLSGDSETTRYQIGREKDRSGSTFELLKQNSLLQYAVLSGQEKMIEMLLEESEKELKKKKNEDSSSNVQKEVLEYLNKGDLVTGFTAFHYAVFVENKSMIDKLIRLGAAVDKKDNFFGTAFDYARMLSILPPRMKAPNSINVWNRETNKLEELAVSKLEKILDVNYNSEILCDNDYIFELMFSGFSITEPDMKFRETYLPLIYSSGGDENLILAEVSPNVGFGVFAAKDFQEGDYIVRYGGKLSSQDNIKDKAYNMASGVEGIGLDGKKFRNLGGMINHCSNCNAESQCVFDKGAEQALITAKTFIPKGHQILLDYSRNYWTKKALKSLTFEDLSLTKPLSL